MTKDEFSIILNNTPDIFNTNRIKNCRGTEQIPHSFYQRYGDAVNFLIRCKQLQNGLHEAQQNVFLFRSIVQVCVQCLTCVPGLWENNNNISILNNFR